MEEEQEVDSDMQQNAPPSLDLSLARSKKSAGQFAPPRKTERLPSARGRHPILARGYEKDGTWAEKSPGHRFIQAVRGGVPIKSAAACAGVARRTVYVESHSRLACSSSALSRTASSKKRMVSAVLS